MSHVKYCPEMLLHRLYVIECSKTDPGCYGVNTFIYHVFQESQSVFSLSHSFWFTGVLFNKFAILVASILYNLAFIML